MDNERTAFEAWIRQKSPCAEFELAPDGEYLVPGLRIKWEVWQARAALEQPYARIPRELSAEVVGAFLRKTGLVLPVSSSKLSEYYNILIEVFQEDCT